MSLTERLAARRQYSTLSNRGCATCKWLATRSEEEQAEIAAWVESGISLNPLHEECVIDGLPVGLSAFTGHFRRCAAEKGKP
ncbi:hypothetical protein [Mycobacterium phage WXIN]|nr:hypothetical protein [Mycobacterium phage WXIN]